MELNQRVEKCDAGTDETGSYKKKKKKKLQMLFGCCKKMLNFTVLQKTRSECESTGAENAAGYKKNEGNNAEEIVN